MSVPNDSVEPIPREARTWAMACHLTALVGLVGNGIGFFLGPLLVWLIKREDHPFIDEQGKEAVNFQLTMIGAMIISGLLWIVLIGIILLPLVVILDIVLTIIAGIKASDGVHYRYPLAIRFIK